MNRIPKLKEMLLNNPADSFLKHALALEYIKGEDDAPAQQLFEEILANEPGYVGTYYHLAKLLERNDETDAAIKNIQAGNGRGTKSGGYSCV